MVVKLNSSLGYTMWSL